MSTPRHLSLTKPAPPEKMFISLERQLANVRRWNEELEWGLHQGDFAAIAAGVGARSASATSLDDVRSAVKDLDLTQGPFVLDCTINPDIPARWLDDAFERA